MERVVLNCEKLIVHEFFNLSNYQCIPRTDTDLRWLDNFGLDIHDCINIILCNFLHHLYLFQSFFKQFSVIRVRKSYSQLPGTTLVSLCSLERVAK